MATCGVLYFGVRHRQRRREVAGAAQRIDLPALRVEDGVERGDEADQGHEAEARRRRRRRRWRGSRRAAGSSEEPSAKLPTPTIEGLSSTIMKAESDQRQHARA